RVPRSVGCLEAWGASKVREVKRDMGRFLVTVTAVLVGLVVAGALAIWLFKALLGLAFYLVVGAVVVGGGAYLYYRTKRAIGPGTRIRNGRDVAGATSRQRDQ